MKELSIFVDESGDFGEYDYHSPYYIITMIFHDQDISLSEDILILENELNNINLDNHCIHTGPIIRREENYSNMSVKDRRRIFNKIIAFAKHIDFKYKCFYIEKKHIEDSVEASGKLSKQISNFIRDHYSIFLDYDNIKVYYDNGQIQVNKILSSVFNALLPNITFKKVIPSKYKLFQIADLLCTLKLIEIKIENKSLSKSEIGFIGNLRDFKKNYIKKINSKEWK